MDTEAEHGLFLLVVVLGLDLLLLLDYGPGVLGCHTPRGIVPALRHPQPVLRQPQQSGARLLVLRGVCGVKT
jgi:hypothetical protein